MKLTPELKKKNVIALRDFLWEVSKEPAKYNQNALVLKALSSQGELAKYNNEEKEIFASSLNTLKRHSEKWLVGGYTSLEDARCSAKDNIENFVRNSRKRTGRTKKALEEKITQLTIQDKQMSNDNLLLAGALRTALRYMREYARSSNDVSLIKRSERDCNEILTLFSLGNHPVIVHEELSDAD